MRTASDTTIAFVWYDCDTERRHFCYYKYFQKKRDTKREDDNEKKLLQAKHRLEEAQMRDRQKERKARTRRLIQEGAILEKVYPAATDMDLTKLEDFLYWALR